VGYGKRALAAAQAPNTGPGLVYKRASALALGCNTVPVLAWCTLGDLPYYIVTLHCRRSTSDRPAADDDGKSGIEARKLEIMIARARARRESEKRRSFEKREIGLPRTNAPRSFRCDIRDTFPMGKELAAPGINRKVSSLPVYLRENEVTQFRAGYVYMYHIASIVCAQSMTLSLMRSGLLR